MPHGDRAGQAGAGFMTGRAFGFYTGYPWPGYINPSVNHVAGGRGRGRSGAWGRGNRIRAGRNGRHLFGCRYPISIRSLPYGSWLY